MKKSTNLFRIAAMAAMVAMALGCTEKPGPEKPSNTDCQQVYFTADNSDLIIVEEGQTSFTVKVAREKTDAAITVPIKANKKSDGLTVPESVSFAAGEKEATITVSIPSEIAVKTVLDLELELTGEHVDAFLEGAETIYSTQIANPLKTQAKTYITGKEDRYGYWATEVWVVSDSYIIMPDFWNSGVDVTLKAFGSQDERVYMAFSANAGYYAADEEYTGGHSWWMYDNANESWITLYPFGEDAWFKIEGMDFYYSDETYDYDMAWYEPDNNYITFTMGTVYYSDRSGADYWNYVAIDWKESSLEGFEPELPEQKEGPSTEFTLWFESDPENTYTNYGDWEDYYTIAIEDFLGSGETFKVTVDDEDNITGYPGLVYDEDYAGYHVDNWCNCLGDWTWIYIYGAVYGSTYSYDDGLLTLKVYNYFYNNSDKSDYDTLYIQENW